MGLKDPEKKRLYERERRRTHLEQMRRYAREYKKAHPAETMAYKQRFLVKHPGIRATYHRHAMAVWVQRRMFIAVQQLKAESAA